MNHYTVKNKLGTMTERLHTVSISNHKEEKIMNKYRLMSFFVILATLFSFANVNTAGAATMTVTLQEGTATFSQGDWCCNLNVDEAVDGQLYDYGASGIYNGWATYNVDHVDAQTALWETASDVNASQLDFTLYHTFAAAYSLGRFRLSYTTDDRGTFADGLNSYGDVTANWTVLTGATISSTGGETFTELADGSILVSGPAPDTTIYSVGFSGNFSGITGIRLESLKDPSLPYGGPGRGGNGNWHLVEITLDATLNEPPTAIASGPYQVAIGQQTTFDGSASSDSDGDFLTESWTADGGTMAGSTYTAGSLPGIYDVQLIVNDGKENSQPAMTMVVVYDPSGGFVTGGGWIDSPAGAYTADPSLTGKASFGFVAKYKQGANVPDGNTQFQFKAGDLNFRSSSYEWLVVAGNKAQFKGEGTIKGQGSFKFMITADNDSPDTFRIKIWLEDNGVETVVYDNGSQQSLGGGSIVIHK
jgi:hypothetical protein